MIHLSIHSSTGASPPPPSSSSLLLLLLLLGTDAPSPSAERMSAPWMLSQWMQSCTEDSRETLWAALRSGTECAAFSFSNCNLGIPVNYKKQKDSWNLWGTEDDLSGQHGISGELCVPPLLACCSAAGWVPPPPKKKKKIHSNDSVETLIHQQCTTSTAASGLSGVVLAASRCA